MDFLWSTFQGPLFAASMELWNAARTDEALRVKLIEHERTLGVQIRDLCADLFGPKLAEHKNFETTMVMIIQAMRGEAISSILRSPSSKRDEELLSTLTHAATDLLA